MPDLRPVVCHNQADDAQGRSNLRTRNSLSLDSPSLQADFLVDSLKSARGSSEIRKTLISASKEPMLLVSAFYLFGQLIFCLDKRENYTALAATSSVQMLVQARQEKWTAQCLTSSGYTHFASLQLINKREFSFWRHA